jgi:hypothetical protein
MSSPVFEFRSMPALALSAAVLCITATGYAQVQARDASAPYPTMAPIAQYMAVDANAEITLARSAAPAAVSRDATVLVLGQHGYETGAKGTNGFVCIVERSWMNRFDAPDFWNPKTRSPVCLNPQAARSVLPYDYKRTELVFAGVSKEQIKVRVKQAIDSKEIPALELGAMSYMMSKQGRLSDELGHWQPHLMFYSTKTDGADWGANQADSPVMLDTRLQKEPEPLNTFLVPVGYWSDGTVAPKHDH